MVRIKWTDKAVKHLEAIYEYISKDSNIYAKRYIKSLIYSTEKLKKMPECGRTVPEFEDSTFREIFYKNHRIVYRLADINKHIDILAVVHGAQDMEKILPEKI
ncbi:MAG: type II toxin-antitoxin system RelE/ParE family toxin [Desulfobacterales bacterium]|nr:type II toxin-antitoxin system RelE/ParE family toxin [Desulfobacterales bacterium]